MKIEYLREFAVLAKHMSFSAAAKELYMTQPGLSSHIQQLEKELGLTLVERSQPMRLTAAGSVVLKGGQQLINLYETMLEQAKAVAEDKPLLVHEILAIPNIFEMLDTTGMAYEFMPYNIGRSVLDDLTNDVVDVTFVMHAIADDEWLDQLTKQGFCARAITKENFVVCVERDSVLGSKESLALSDLDGTEAVIFAAGWFDMWTRVITHLLGDSIHISFRLDPKRSHANIRNAPLDGAAHICTEGSILRSLGDRDDLTIHKLVDGKPITYEWLAVCKTGNSRAETLLELLASAYNKNP